jgi:hypothetical protein
VEHGLHEKPDDDQRGSSRLMTAEGESDPGDRESEEDDHRDEHHREKTGRPAL